MALKLETTYSSSSIHEAGQRNSATRTFAVWNRHLCSTMQIQKLVHQDHLSYGSCRESLFITKAVKICNIIKEPFSARSSSISGQESVSLTILSSFQITASHKNSNKSLLFLPNYLSVYNVILQIPKTSGCRCWLAQTCRI